MNIFLLATVFLMTGCDETELYNRLHEKEANMMMAILLERGIEVKKTAGEEGTVNLSLQQRRFAEAVELLKEYGYPRTDYMGIGDMFQKSGLVSSPTEERIRYMYGLSQDLAETLTLIDGVVDARVHVVLPDNNPFTESNYPASASVVIDYRPDSNVINDIVQIKSFIANSIEGLNETNVSVVLFPIEVQSGFGGLKKGKDTTSFLFIDLPKYSVVPFIILICVLLFIGIGGILTGVYFYRKGQSGEDASGVGMGEGSGGGVFGKMGGSGKEETKEK